MNRDIELFKSYFGVDYDSDHINDNINWCINRGIPSLNFSHINHNIDYSYHISNLGEVITINTGRLV